MRFLVSSLLSLVIAAGLFLIMVGLVSAKQVPNTDPPIAIHLWDVRPDTKPQTKKPPPEEEVKPPQQPVTDLTIDDFEPPVIQTPDIPNLDILATTFGQGQKIDPGPSFKGMGDAAPHIINVVPSYPTDALRQGIEGWVDLEFTVTANGNAVDIKVIDAKPKNVFERDAIRSIARGKFSPRIVDGRAIDERVRERVEFTLTD